MEALRIKRVMIMKPESTLNSKQENSLGHEWVFDWCARTLLGLRLCLQHARRARAESSAKNGNITVGCCRAGHDHPTSTNEGRLNEQMVNGERLNCPSEIIYCFHL